MKTKAEESDDLLSYLVAFFSVGGLVLILGIFMLPPASAGVPPSSFGSGGAKLCDPSNNNYNIPFAFYGYNPAITVYLPSTYCGQTVIGVVSNTLATLVPPGTDLSNAVLTMGTIPGAPSGLYLLTLVGCFITAQPTWSGVLQQLTFTPVVPSGQTCRVQIDPGSLGSPYYVQVGANTEAVNQGWTWDGTYVYPTETTGATMIVSWSPVSSQPGGNSNSGNSNSGSTGSGSTGNGGPAQNPCAPNQVYVNTQCVNASPATNPNAIVATIAGVQIPAYAVTDLVQFILILALGVIGLTSLEKHPYPSIALLAGAVYLIFDLLFYASGAILTLPTPIRLGLIDLSVIGPSIGATLQSGTGTVFFVAVIGLVAGLGLALSGKLDEWIEDAR